MVSRVLSLTYLMSLKVQSKFNICMFTYQCVNVYNNVL